MSRLIDADALMKAMYHRAFETDGDTMWQSGCWVRYKAIEQVVEEMPTIEERKTGKWVERHHAYADEEKVIEEWQSARCSLCGKYHTTPYLYYFDDFNYCPNCGARMDMRGET